MIWLIFRIFSQISDGSGCQKSGSGRVGFLNFFSGSGRVGFWNFFSGSGRVRVSQKIFGFGSGLSKKG